MLVEANTCALSVTPIPTAHLDTLLHHFLRPIRASRDSLLFSAGCCSCSMSRVVAEDMRTHEACEQEVKGQDGWLT